ncbi:MAG: tripartite tricarboxylate transporter substrate binding protein [Betaproteobacteria bacterium]|nr:tripartite tricarboxylate transporter substrate binding protein [Betaproteobacteria bacterium]
MTRSKMLATLWLIGLMGLAPQCLSQAQRYPTRPIQLIVPFAPGGGTDFVARIIGQKLTEVFGQPILIQNVTGASGNIGAERASKSAPDGYTLFMGSSPNAVAMSLFRKVPFDFVRDFVAVTLVGSNPQILVVNPVVPAKSVAELVRLAKRKPGVLTYGSAGAGAASHLGGELLGMTAGIRLLHVPYKGAGPALISVLAGEVDMAFVTVSSALPYVKSGRLRSLAVASPRRSAVASEVPTFEEAGVRNFHLSTWYGVQVPRGTPGDIVERLHAEIVKILRNPDVERRMLEQGIEIIASSPEDFARHIANEVGKWARLIREGGIQQQ